MLTPDSSSKIATLVVLVKFISSVSGEEIMLNIHTISFQCYSLEITVVFRQAKTKDVDETPYA